jgi:hypothetical protein
MTQREAGLWEISDRCLFTKSPVARLEWLLTIVEIKNEEPGIQELSIIYNVQRVT